MLDVISWAAVGLLTTILGQNPAQVDLVPLVSWQSASIFALPTNPDPTVEAIVADYLQRLTALGFPRQQQGVWIQSEWAYLGQNRENIPVSAASLTKIATSLAALAKLGADHRFETRIYTTGRLKDGVLQGDLLIEGGSDPLFVWEEAIAIGNQLNTLGIRQITGNLIINGNFAMNFKSDPQIAGEFLKQALNASLWSPVVEKQYQALPPGTPRPQVEIQGKVYLQSTIPQNAQLLLRHQSLTLAQLLKQMNLYSNNEMAEMLAETVGGASVVAQLAAQAAKVPAAEIQLENGSGLSINNRISPRAVCSMLMALEEKLKTSPLQVTDLFPVGGRDREGTMHWRTIPSGVAIKTGTLAQVSALAGVIPTKERGVVWFAVINHGGNIEQLRTEQDRLLQRLSQHWQIIPVAAKMPSPRETVYLGDPSRNFKEES